MPPWKARLKRGIDIAVASTGLFMTSPVIFIALIVATIETRQWGLFRQLRVGLGGKPFYILKIRTMQSSIETTTVTTMHDRRVTRWGKFFRRTKIDELPQLWNVLCGDMSLVGPRPDVPELVNTLPYEVRRIVLSVRPGITGPASVRFRNEEVLLGQQADPERYNREVLFPEKARLNCSYIQDYHLRSDAASLAQTIFPIRVESLPAAHDESRHRRTA